MVGLKNSRNFLSQSITKHGKSNTNYFNTVVKTALRNSVFKSGAHHILSASTSLDAREHSCLILLKSYRHHHDPYHHFVTDEEACRKKYVFIMTSFVNQHRLPFGKQLENPWVLP